MKERDQASLWRPRSQGLRVHATKWQRLSAALLAIVAFLLFSPTLQPIGIGLDNSWRYGLSELAGSDFFRETPIIFTYGSLGYLVRGATTEKTFAAILIFRIAVYCLYFCVISIYMINAKEGPKRILVIAALLMPSITSLYKPFFQTEFQLALIPVFLLSLQIKRRGSLSLWLIASLGAYAGILLHTKTSLAYFSAPLVLAYLTGEWLQGSSPLTARSIGLLSSKYFTAFAAFIIGSTIVRGTALPRDLLLFAQISSGYSAGMSRGGSAIEMTIAAVLLIISLAFTSLLLLNKESRNIGLMLALDFLLLIMFKHAFVRQGHAPRFFVTVPIVLAIVLTQPRVSPLSPRQRLLAWGLSIVTIIGALLWVIVPLTWRNQIATHLGNKTALITDPGSLRRRINQQSESSLSKLRLSKELKTKIGSNSVDVIPRELSVVAANNLNWRPRPTLQSYQGYTHDLDRKNAHHLLTSGPDFIIAHFDSLDAKHQSFYSPKEWLALACNYVSAASEKSSFMGTIYLLERNGSSRCKETKRSPVIPVQWREAIKLDNNVDLTVAEIMISYSILGKLIETIYRAPPVWLDVEYADGERHTYRFNHLNSGGGIVVSPLPRNATELRCSFSPSLTNCESARARRITLWTSFTWMFSASPTVQLKSLSLT